MFFRYNKQEKRAPRENMDENALFEFFQTRNKDELLRFADEASEEAKELFDVSVQGLLGQMPDEICQTQISMNKESLQQMLFSSMMTGYLAKVAENKLDLEKCWAGEEKSESQDDFAIEKQLENLADDDMKGIL